MLRGTGCWDIVELTAWIHVASPPVNIVHEEEGASCFPDVHCCVDVLDPDREPEVGECSWLSLHEGAFHRPEHGFCQHT